MARKKTKSLKAEPFSVDVKQLEKGDYLGPDKCSTWMNARPDSKDYNFKLMAFKNRIEDELRQNGHYWTLKCEANGIRILTDAEASNYNQRQHELSIERLHRAHVRQMGVDCNNLTKDEEATHNRRLTTQGAILISIDMAQQRIDRMPELKPYKRLD